MNELNDKQVLQPAMIHFATDLPNICSLVGLLSALMAIYFTILGNFHVAVIGMIWSVFFDWGDGINARKMKGRTEKQWLPRRPKGFRKSLPWTWSSVRRIGSWRPL